MGPPDNVRIDNAFLQEDTEKILKLVEQLAGELGQTEETSVRRIRSTLGKTYVLGLVKGVRAAGAEPEVVDEPEIVGEP